MSFRQSRFFKFRKSNSEGEAPSPTSEVPQVELPVVEKKRDLLAPPSLGDLSPLPSPDLNASRPLTSGSSFSRRASSFFLASNSSAVSLSSASTKGPALDTCREENQKKRNVLHKSKNEEEYQGPSAWVSGHRDRVPYDLHDLLNGQPVPEIWDESGDCLVYLFPRESEKNASFKVKSSIFASSRRLHASADEAGMRDSFDHKTYEKHLYIAGDTTTEVTAPPANTGLLDEETESLVAVRNLFAFLMGRSLVATQRCPTIFEIFLNISKQLKSHEFSNVDGSSFGQVVTANFDAYIDEFELADVRSSNEKTVESIVLGERMKNVKLYNEAFTHAAGKYDSIQKDNPSSLSMVSPMTINRLGRAVLNLEKHTEIVSQTLEGLEFPSLFTGIMSSRGERKTTNFGHWRDSFYATRKWYINFYKGRYKRWPPRTSRTGASPNRPILRDLYHDLCSVYDLLVDRTTRNNSEDTSGDNLDSVEPRARAVRQIFGEYDRSSPPVKPSIPYDVPLIPSLLESGSGDSKKDEKATARRIKDDEMSKILAASHNQDAETLEFVEAFKEMERRAAHLRKIGEVKDNRMGQWIFIYALLQVLPLLVVDAPGLQHTSGVEYFLCEPPKSGVPWAREDAPKVPSPSLGVPSVKAATAVSLPADLAGPGVEGMYYRSHCWVMAEKWQGSSGAASSELRLPKRAGTDPAKPASVRVLRESDGRPGSLSRIKSSTSTASSSLSVPGSGPRPQRARPVSVYDPTRTFDSFLSDSVPPLPETS